MLCHVLSVSMPRSGHHLLEQLLQAALGARFGYCEFYMPPGCCRKIPCAKPSAQAFMQKSHDFKFEDPLCPSPNIRRIVQYRSPVPRALSNYELHLRNGHPDTPETFRRFLAYEAAYTCLFYRKWIEPRNPSFFYLPYEEMVADPMKTVLSVLRFLDIAPDGSMPDIVAASATRARHGVKFRTNAVSAHRYSSLPMLANFEALTIRHCPGWFPTRYFNSSYEDAQNSIIGTQFKERAIRMGLFTAADTSHLPSR